MVTSNIDRLVYVVSAPSGGGKTTLNRRLVAEFPERVEVSISETTRKPRAGEEDGKHYYFVSVSAFQQHVQAGSFVEWAEVHSNYYGTTHAELVRITNAGRIPLLEIDVQGWASAQKVLPQARSVFILPPDLRTLWKRLDSRGSDDLQTRWLRFNNAFEEIRAAATYEVFIVNDNIDEAYQQLASVIVHGENAGLAADQGHEWCAKLKEEFTNADWIQEIRSSVDKPQ